MCVNWIEYEGDIRKKILNKINQKLNKMNCNKIFWVGEIIYDNY